MAILLIRSDKFRKYSVLPRHQVDLTTANMLRRVGLHLQLYIAVYSYCLSISEHVDLIIVHWRVEPNLFTCLSNPIQSNHSVIVSERCVKSGHSHNTFFPAKRKIHWRKWKKEEIYTSALCKRNLSIVLHILPAFNATHQAFASSLLHFVIIDRAALIKLTKDTLVSQSIHMITRPESLASGWCDVDNASPYDYDYDLSFVL